MKNFFTQLSFTPQIPSKGKLLLAEPLSEDPFFKRSVILLVDHDHNGETIGLMLNKSTHINIGKMIKGFPNIDTEVYLGGPVSKDHLFYLHQRVDLLPNSKEIIPGLYWGGDFETLKYVLKSGEMTSNDILFFAGYSGWDKGQLETELKEKSWIVAKTNAPYILGGKKKRMWKEVLSKMGKPFQIMSNFPESPALN